MKSLIQQDIRLQLDHTSLAPGLPFSLYLVRSVVGFRKAMGNEP